MKNKRTLYVLIPLVAVIWGIIIWQFSSYQPVRNDGELSITESHDSVMEDSARYDLNTRYRDPFLRSRQFAPKQNDKKKTNNIKTVKLNSVTALKQPEGLIYRGVISGNHTRIGLLEIGGKKLLIRENSTVSEYRIVTVGSDSLKIRFHDKLYAYAKQ